MWNIRPQAHSYWSPGVSLATSRVAFFFKKSKNGFQKVLVLLFFISSFITKKLVYLLWNYVQSFLFTISDIQYLYTRGLTNLTKGLDPSEKLMRCNRQSASKREVQRTTEFMCVSGLYGSHDREPKFMGTERKKIDWRGICERWNIKLFDYKLKSIRIVERCTVPSIG